MDEREGEEIKQKRLEIIEQEHGVWRCQTQFSCTEVCPKDIPPTEHIQELKREAVKNNLKFWCERGGHAQGTPNLTRYHTTMHEHDVIVVGAGGGTPGGDRGTGSGADVAIVSKLHPVRSHTGAAEGGINAHCARDRLMGGPRIRHDEGVRLPR